jgi:hypothetical protein
MLKGKIARAKNARVKNKRACRLDEDRWWEAPPASSTKNGSIDGEEKRECDTRPITYLQPLWTVLNRCVYIA